MYDDGDPQWANFMRHNAPDIVWLYKANDSDELLYSTRSLAANLTHRGAWIIGDRPRWWTGRHVPYGPMTEHHRSTFAQLHAACENPEISDPFILANDDMFALEQVGLMPTYHRGTIASVVATNEANGVRNGYAGTIVTTGEMLRSMGYDDPICYELHVPMVIHKRPMLEALAICEEQARHLSLGPKRWLNKRTMYGNIAGIGGEQIEDVKVSKRLQERPAGPWLSTNENTFRYFRDELEAMFPEPSRYER